MKSEPSYEVRLLLSLSKTQLLATCVLVFIFSSSLATVFVTAVPTGSTLAKWEPLSVPEEYIDDFKEIKFFNSTHGLLLGSNALLQTTDGGNSWSACLTVENLGFFRLSVVTPLDIWVSGYGPLRHSVDGGVTWVNVYSLDTVPDIVEFYNTTHGMVGDSHSLYRTIDGGISWQSSINWSYQHNSIHDFHLSAATVRVATSDGYYLSEDWGITWEVVDSRSTRGISFITEDEGWILHYQSFSHQVNGTLCDIPRVARIQVPSNSYYNDIEFIDSDNGWIVGIGPSVIYSPDGGNSWYEQECPNYFFRSVDFINETHGWAAGSSGAVARTVTGNSLGPHLPSGFLLTLGFTGGGTFVPYISIIVGTISTMVTTFLINIFRRKIRKNEKPQLTGPQIDEFN